MSDHVGVLHFHLGTTVLQQILQGFLEGSPGFFLFPKDQEVLTHVHGLMQGKTFYAFTVPHMKTMQVAVWRPLGDAVAAGYRLGLIRLSSESNFCLGTEPQETTEPDMLFVLSFHNSQNSYWTFHEIFFKPTSCPPRYSSVSFQYLKHPTAVPVSQPGGIPSMLLRQSWLEPEPRRSVWVSESCGVLECRSMFDWRYVILPETLLYIMLILMILTCPAILWKQTQSGDVFRWTRWVQKILLARGGQIVVCLQETERWR